MAGHLRTQRVLDALQTASLAPPTPGVVHHSDQGLSVRESAFGAAPRRGHAVSFRVV
jgi:hypothetical protein